MLVLDVLPMRRWRHSSRRRRRWNSIGSGGFAVTLLAVLGLGGGFVLALLPFNSGARSAAALRDSPEFRSLPRQHSPPSTERLRDPEVRHEVIVAAAAAATTLNVRGEFSFDAPPPTLIFVNATEIPSPSGSNEFESAINPPTFNSASERFSIEGQSAKTSVAAFESLQTESIPEPATWILFLCGILLGAFAFRSRRQSPPAESQDWIR